MDRPRFQISIRTMMAAVVVVSLIFGLGPRINILCSALVIVVGTKRVYLMRARAGCRAEGRAWSESEERSAERVAFGITLVLVALLAIANQNRR